ncbi:retron system putative HNH endonuclease [Glaciimonas sp. GG7]
MRPIKHPFNPPQALQRAIARGAGIWDHFDGKAAVSEVLMQLQKHLCAYCQIELDSQIGSHIEHIWPKHAHSDRTFEWTNLVLSCTYSEKIGATKANGGVSCGHSDGKRDWARYDSRFISPTLHNCDHFFEYLVSDGTVQAAAGLSVAETERATYTITLLNLNCRRLCRLRKDLLEEGYRIIGELMAESVNLMPFLDCELSEMHHKLPMFITARQQHFGSFLDS